MISNSTSPKKISVLAGGLVACILAAGTAVAAPQLYAQANGADTWQSETLASGTATAASASSYISSGAPVSHEESSYAAFGLLGVYAGASAGSNGSGGGTYGNSLARFEDDITITAVGMDGQSGLVIFLLEVDGTLSSEYVTEPLYEDSQSYAYASISVLHNGNGVYGANRYAYANGATSGANFLDAPISVSIPFTFGTAFTLRVALQAQTTAYALFGANSVSDLGHTLTWGGVVSVTSGGNPVAGYSMDSTSGTNYISPIPEPATAPLVVLAVAMLAGTSRTRAKSPGVENPAK